MQLRWREEARREFRKVVRAIAAERSKAGSIVSGAVYEAIDRIVRFPHIGFRIKKNGDRDIRQTSAGSYRIIYAIEGDLVEILRVMHRRREVPIDRIRDAPWDPPVTPPFSPQRLWSPPPPPPSTEAPSARVRRRRGSRTSP
jgi:toxin ParE1/3/4